MKEISEFYPIKLSPGFICIAFHLGCIGCNFCSVRYGNPRNDIFLRKINKKYPITPREMYSFLNKMPSFYAAKLPIRIGSDTDFKFEEDETTELINMLPNDYPIIVLTRFPISDKYKSIFCKNNVLLKITITPDSRYLDSPSNQNEILDSLVGIQSETMITIGPIDADNYYMASKLIGHIPNKSNFSVYIKGLNDEFHPSLKLIPQVADDVLIELKNMVMNKGMRHLSQLTCPLSNRLKFAHKRVSDVPDLEKKFCLNCRMYDTCFSDEGLNDVELNRILNDLGLMLIERPEKKDFKSYLLKTDKPTAFGDEAYLSELFKMKIKISNTREGTDSFKYSSSMEVMERWEKACFFPYREISNRFDDFISEIFGSTSNRRVNR